MIAAATKAHARTRHKVLDGARHQHLARAGERRHARTDVNGNAADIIADHFALAGMKPGADFNPQRPDFVCDGASAPYGACGTVESSKDAIAGRLHFVAAEARKGTPYRGVMGVKE